MKKIAIDQFLEQTHGLVKIAAEGDDFFEIDVEKGISAVLISKEEWTMLRDGMALLLANAEKIQIPSTFNKH